jgi:hypothetical protein
MSRARPLFRSSRTALTVGVALYVAGAVCIWDAYEHRGKNRPFWPFKLAGGWV